MTVALFLLASLLSPPGGDHAGLDRGGYRPENSAESISLTGWRFLRNDGRIRDTRGKKRDDILYSADFGSLRVYFFRDRVSYVFLERTGGQDDDVHECIHTHEAASGHSCGVTLVRDAYRAYRVDARFGGASRRVNLRPVCPGPSLSRAPLSPAVETETLVYEGIYPGIDAVFTVKKGGIKCDWVLQPGARPENIELAYIGAKAIRIQPSGDLLIETPLGSIIEGAPLLFPVEGADRPETVSPDGNRALPARFELAGSVVRLRVPTYDARFPMLIDPFVEWSTYMGGGSTDFGTGTAIDPDGNVLLCGWTTSIDFPVSAGVLQTVHAGREDAFVAKFDPSGVRLWTTFLGGDTLDIAMGIATDHTGSIAVIGYTASRNFPVTTGAFQGNLRGSHDVFLAKLGPDGTVMWSTFIGGSMQDEGGAVAFDATGNILVTGRTVSGDFPASFGSFQFTKAGYYDAFIGKFRPDGTRAWMTFYGGNSTPDEYGEDWGHSIAAAPNGDVIVCGHTTSPDFPVTPDAFQRVYRSNRDGFLVRFSANGARLYATFIGGSAWDDAYGLSVDRRGDIILTGGVESQNFPVTPGAFQTVRRGTTDAFIGRFDSSGACRWLTLIGSSGSDYGHGTAVYPSGNALVVGKTDSTDFPVTPSGPQPARCGPDYYDAFIVKISPEGKPLWSTYYGGSDMEYGIENEGLGRVAADWRGTAAVSGWTVSRDFPVTPMAFQKTHAGGWDAFLVKLGCNVSPPVITAEGPTSFCEGGSVRLVADSGYAHYFWSTGDTTRAVTVSRSGMYTVRAIDADDCGAASAEIPVTVFPLPTPLVLPLGPTAFCEQDSVVLDGGEGFLSYRWSTGDTSRMITVKTSVSVSVTVVDSNGCTSVSPAIDIVVYPRPVVSVTASGPLAFCDGGSVTLDAGAGHARYRWSTGDTTRRLTVTRSGIYDVVVTNAFGCEARSLPVTVTVYPLPKPSIVALGDTVLCEGDSVTLDAGSGYLAYTWTTGERTRNIVVRSAGLYGVTVTDSNGCMAPARPVAVTVNPRPRPVIISLGPTSFCEGGEVILDAGAGYASYRWSTGDTGRTLTVRRTGSYSVTTAFETGCTGTSPPVAVLVHANPSPVITPAGLTSFCDGDSVELRAPAGFVRYRWSNGSTSPAIVVRAAGSYTVQVEDTNGCIGVSPPVEVVVFPLPPVPVITQRKDTLFSTRASGYRWKVDGATIPGGDEQRLIIPRSGTYTVTVFNEYGCSAESAPFPVTIATAAVRLPDTEAAPGEFISIPLLLTGSENLFLAGAKDFRARVRFESSILEPAVANASWSRSGADYVFEVQGGASDTVGVLATIPCRAMLGAVERIPLRIESFEWTAGAVRTMTADGVFSLIICREGGPRLFDGSKRAFLAQNRPNPFNAQTVISFGLVEAGPMRLAVFDMLGRRVKILEEGMRDAGRYETVFDAGDLPSGSYRVVLDSGTTHLTRVVHLVK
ncbi:MAG: SBBP repeat-containing protein [Bacteroidota bacterium]|nr:SBBP repeat-containing protein [Bacteroidota bacterium]